MDLTPSLIDAFWSRVRKLEGENACWLWTDRVGTAGDGRFAIGLKTYPATRVAWTIINGPINPRVNLWRRTEICHAKACVRPDHLRFGQPALDNVTEEIEREARERFLEGTETVAAIALDLELSEEMVRRIGHSDSEPSAPAGRCLVANVAPGTFVIAHRGGEEVLDDAVSAIEKELPQIVERLELLTLRVALEGEYDPTVLDSHGELTTLERCERGIRLLRDLKRFLNR